jgi:ABC-type nitrate/sulfonate/bicarbonate transport system substrate-binding protein
MTASPRPLDRRAFLRLGATGTLGLATAALLEACGSSSKSSSSATTTSATATSATSTASATTAAGATPTTMSSAAYPLSFQLSWLNTVEFAGSYFAEKNGYYGSNGVAVKLLPGGPNVSVEPLIAQGTAFVGQSGIDQIAQAVNNGAALKIVAMLFQRNPFCVVSKASTPIKTPQDLLGKKIGVAAANQTAWNAFVKLNKLDASKIHNVPVQFDPTPVATGQVDGQVVFVDNEVIQLQLKGVQTATLLFEDFNYHLATDAYAVLKSTLTDTKKRQALVGFLRGDIKGWQDALAQPEAAAHLTVDQYGKTIGLGYDQQLGEMKAQTPLIQNAYTQTHGLATIDPSAISTWLTTLSTSGITASESLFDLTVLPEVYQGKTSL